MPSGSCLVELRVEISRMLEDGVLDSAWSRSLAKAFEGRAARAIARPLHVPSGLVTIAVGGATLGGSGKTRVALAATKLLARGGADVVLVGHGYRARPSAARVVRPDDALSVVGDEALACARSLDADPSACHARVVVARSRQAAVDFAATLSPKPTHFVIDGPLQLAPRPASVALLAVDARSPWGSGAVAPAGDLRAPAAALLAHADFVVPVPASIGAISLEPRRRAGLFTALARPQRLVTALAERGIVPSVHVRAPDHGPLSRSFERQIARAPVEVWIATEKCATHLLDAKITTPLAILAEDFELDAALVSHMGALTPKGARA